MKPFTDINFIPLVSVIIPTHNRAKRLKKAIVSVLEQEEADIELIIVADACKDDTRAIVRSFNDDRIRLIETIDNVGGGQARNIGIDHAKGKYLAFLDDDDVWFPQKLSLQIEVMEKDPGLILVTCGFYKVKNGVQQRVILPQDFGLHDCLFHNIPRSFSFVMLRRADLGELRIDGTLKSCQDWDLWIKLLEKTRGRGMGISKPLVYHFEHDDGRISDFGSRKILGQINFLKNHWVHLTKNHQYYNRYAILIEVLRTYKFSIFERARFIWSALILLLRSKEQFNWFNVKMAIGKIFWKGVREKESALDSIINFVLLNNKNK